MANRKKTKTLHNKIMKTVREIVIDRDKSTCQHCNKVLEGRNAHLSHIKSKGAYKHLQYDPKNLKILCFRCHILFWHKEPTEAGEWFRRKFPDRYKYLEEKAQETPYNFNSEENLKCILKNLQKMK